MTTEPVLSEAVLKPCPFCGSPNVDPEGWAALDAQNVQTSGPACDDCGASAQSVERWNARQEGRQALASTNNPEA